MFGFGFTPYKSYSLVSPPLTPRLIIDLTDSSKYPVSAGGTMSQSNFLAASGITLNHTTESSGVGMTVEGATNSVITFPTGSSLGTLIQGAIARFSTVGCRKEQQRTNMIVTNYVGNPGAGPSAGWTAAASATESTITAPDGSTNATRSIVSSGGSSAAQLFVAPSTSANTDDYVLSSWSKATVNGTPLRALLYLSGLYASQRNPTQSNNWSHERVIGRNTNAFAPGATLAIATVRGVNEAGFAAEALDASWFLPQVEYGTQISSSAIITPSGATGTRNADLWTLPASSIVSSSGVFAPEFIFTPDGACPYQLNGNDGELWLWHQNANNWGKIMARTQFGFRSTQGAGLYYGGYVAVCIGGNIEIIGHIEWAAGETIDLQFSQMGNGFPLEAYYSRSNFGGNSNPIYLGKSNSAFGGNSMPNTGTISILDNGTTMGASMVVQGLAFY